MELYFVPQDNSLEKIYIAVNSANHYIYVSMMTFADDNLGNLMITVYQEEKDLSIIIEKNRKKK